MEEEVLTGLRSVVDAAEGPYREESGVSRHHTYEVVHVLLLSLHTLHISLDRGRQ